MDQALKDLIVVNKAAERRLVSVLNKAPMRRALSAGRAQAGPGQCPEIASASDELTLVLVQNEVSAAHGTGILIHRLLRDVKGVAVVRTYTHYDNNSLFPGPDVVLPETARGRAALYAIAVDWFRPGQVKRVICVPWAEPELELALALKRVHGVELVLYIMDDNCLLSGQLPRALMAEVIEAADLCLVISPEMQNAYQNAFRKKMWILPPVLDPSLLLSGEEAEKGRPRSERGIVVGNIWSQTSLDLFCAALSGSNIMVDWYCNTSSPTWLDLDSGKLSAAGITIRAPLSEAELVQVLRQYAFAMLPSGTLDERDPIPNIGGLSLPSRVPFILASAATPIIVLGSPRTAAGAFVSYFGVGVTADYDPESLKAAAAVVSHPTFQERVRQNGAKIGRTFAATGMAEWVFRATALGRPPDMRFEEMLDYRRREFGYFVPVPAPAHVVPDFRPAYEGLERLLHRGFKPDFVVDIGSSTGVWSSTMSELFPEARYVLVDPLIDRYPADEVRAHVSRIPHCETLQVAVSDREGEFDMMVSDNLYGSSLLGVGSEATVSTQIRVPVLTLDRIAHVTGLSGRGLVKIDVQFAEHLVIEGGAKFIREAVDCLVVELTIEREFPDARTMTEVVAQLDMLGFQWADQAGEWRELATGRLEQIDIVFVRKGIFARPGLSIHA